MNRELIQSEVTPNCLLGVWGVDRQGEVGRCSWEKIHCNSPLTLVLICTRLFWPSRMETSEADGNTLRCIIHMGLLLNFHFPYKSEHREVLHCPLEVSKNSKGKQYFVLKASRLFRNIVWFANSIATQSASVLPIIFQRSVVSFIPGSWYS